MTTSVGACKSADEIGRLLAVESRLAGQFAAGSLSPERVATRRPSDILRELGARGALGAGLCRAFADGVAEIVLAISEAFPHNIFWDFEFLLRELADGVAGSRGSLEVLRERVAEIGELQRLFGRHTALRFRYVHDFLYGFDWAKWVARRPAERAGVRPFDPPFLHDLARRGRQLLTVIAQGSDGAYPPLGPGRDRSPFPFARDDRAERAIHTTLARRGWIPVQAWKLDAKPRWDEPFAQRREQVAAELGLTI